ncbi:MAG: hypothetical protein ACKO3G_08890 [Planctomycetaceae bacterium]
MAKKSTPKPPKTIKVVSDEPESSTPAGESKINKSEEIRVEARKLMDAGEKPGPKIIIEKLAARGIEVSSPQVSQVLKKLGVAQRPRKTKGKSPSAPVSAAPRAVSSNDSFTIHELIAAKQFVEMVGSGSRAASLLEALNKIR